MTARRVSLAARNNALWCHSVCHTHGLVGELNDTAWSSPARTPPLYPDAVTLTTAVLETDLLRRIDTSVGVSVKDSWARLALSEAGFVRVIEGEWLWRDPADGQIASAGDDRTWRSVASAAEMEQWTKAWAADPQDDAILRSSLLDLDGVHVLAAAGGDDDFAAGCIVNVTGEVAGVSNLFAATGDAAHTWLGAAGAASELVPGRALVGWDSGAGVEAARSAGFESVGPLTVWVR